MWCPPRWPHVCRVKPEIHDRIITNQLICFHKNAFDEMSVEMSFFWSKSHRERPPSGIDNSSMLSHVRRDVHPSTEDLGSRGFLFRAYHNKKNKQTKKTSTYASLLGNRLCTCAFGPKKMERRGLPGVQPLREQKALRIQRQSTSKDGQTDALRGDWNPKPPCASRQETCQAQGCLHPLWVRMRFWHATSLTQDRVTV